MEGNNMFSAVKRFFSAVLRSFWGVLKVVFAGATELILAQLKDVAIQTVSELESTDLTNEQKRQEAFNRIVIYAKNKGIDAKASLINLIIEIALQFIKSKING